MPEFLRFGPSAKRSVRQKEKAFSRIELLMVMVVAANLAALVVPGFGQAARNSQSIRCLNNQKIIGAAASAYASDHDDAFHHVPNGAGLTTAPNGGKWTRNPQQDAELSAEDIEAYWGIAYRPYTGRTKELWRCPSARVVDEWRETGVRYPSSFWLDSTYGLNRYVVTPLSQGSNLRRLADFPSPSTTVFAQDAAEQRMEGEDDSLGLFPGQPECLTQWKLDLRPFYPERRMEDEWFRHPACNTLWLDGHVSPIRYTKTGIDYRHYTGELIL